MQSSTIILNSLPKSPEKYQFLDKKSKCGQESYYDCIASELDQLIRDGFCSKKCMPVAFSFGRNYSVPFCQWKFQEICPHHIVKVLMKMMKQNFNSTKQKIDGTTNCKPSCKLLQYSGMVDAIRPKMDVNQEKYNHYGFRYEFSEHKGIVFEEYLIYDIMDVIGSVGGTLGMFIGFSMDGVVFWAINYIKKSKTLGI